VLDNTGKIILRIMAGGALVIGASIFVNSVHHYLFAPMGETQTYTFWGYVQALRHLRIESRDGAQVTVTYDNVHSLTVTPDDDTSDPLTPGQVRLRSYINDAHRGLEDGIGFTKLNVGRLT
jgi:hypothetical protein